MKDLHNNVKVSVALTSALTTATTQRNGSAIDRQGYESLEFVALTGVVTVTAVKTISLKVQESDISSSSGFSDAAAGDIIGTNTEFSYSGAGSAIANLVRKIGYRGNKRYVRVVRVAGTSATGIVGAVAVQGNPHIAAPVA